MNRADRRAHDLARRRLKAGRADSGWIEVPREKWPAVPPPLGLTRLLRNERFVVMVCDRPGGVTLLMVQRVDGAAGITWDELYAAKAALGFGDHEAVEIYPPADRLVNSANMRHLWVLPAGRVLPFGLDRARAGAGLP